MKSNNNFNNIILSTKNIDELINDIANEVMSRIAEYINKPKQEDKMESFVSRNEALEFLGVTGATLWRWEKQGKVKSYGMGGKRYYRLSELDQSITHK